MSGLSNLNRRLAYQGGNQEGRFQLDKLNSLRGALLYSYQAGTIILEDGRAFRALINEDKLKGDYDNEKISIPYEDVCLGIYDKQTGIFQKKDSQYQKTSQGREQIFLKCGDTFTLVKKNKPISHWLVYLEDLTEDAYFMADIRRCDQQVEINGKKYWTYIRGPVETSIPWNQKAKIEWNDMNYSLVMYIKKDENTLKEIHRFTKIKVPDKDGLELKTWQVVGVNSFFADGIIQVNLDEYFENTIEEEALQEKKANEVIHPPVSNRIPHIVGPESVEPYSEHIYNIVTLQPGGTWYAELLNGEKFYIIEPPKKQKKQGAWVNLKKPEKLLLEQISKQSIKVFFNTPHEKIKLFYTAPNGISVEYSIEVNKKI